MMNIYRWSPTSNQQYVSWKDNSMNNPKKVIIEKNIKNNIPTNEKNYIRWPDNCTSREKYKFNKNPIKGYRKQLTVLDKNETTFSNQSLIGSLDKPNNYNVTNLNTCDDLSKNLFLHSYFLNLDNNINSINCNNKCLIIKSANTILNNNYSSSNKEYLNRKCKTFLQNLPKNDITNQYCSADNNNNNCNIVFNPSNKKYQTQGPISSSARIAGLKYTACVNNKTCYSYIQKSDNNLFNNVENNSNHKTGNIDVNRSKMKKSNIKILK